MNYQSYIVTLALKGGNVVSKKVLADSTWHAKSIMQAQWSGIYPEASVITNLNAKRAFRKV